jgi:DNA repair exonuclease SbcCD ATPase subunit
LQENKLVEDLQLLKAQKAMKLESETSTKATIEKLSGKISEVQKNVKIVASAIREGQNIQDEIRLEEDELSSYQSSMEQIEKQDMVSQLTNEYSELERHAQSCNDKMSLLNLQGDSRAKLSIKKKEAAKKKSDFDSM